jgi:hypothetical protein
MPHVMAGFDPAGFLTWLETQNLDARHTAGHDEETG